MVYPCLYRIPVATLTDFSLSDEQVNNAVEWVSEKPLSDGIRLDPHGNVYITDVENQGFALFTPNGELKTLIEDQRIRWADGATIAADGYCYFTDSAIPDMMLMSKEHMKKKKPYFIFRFKTKEDFSLKDFHIKLMKIGNMPTSLMREALFEGV